jgi:signal peptidase
VPHQVRRGFRRVLGLLWLASLAVLVGLVLLTHVGRLAGFESFAIRGGSMAPTLPVGSLVVVGRIDPATIEPGDVVTYRGENGVVVTHRVVEVDASEAEVWLRTRGDANATPDGAPVPLRAVVGGVTAVIPLLGFLAGMLTLPAGVASVAAYFLALTLGAWLLEDERPQARAPREIRDARSIAG